VSGSRREFDRFDPQGLYASTGDLADMVAARRYPVCDICDGPLSDDEEGPLNGKGFFLEARGDERRVHEVPLCPACATGIGVAVRRAIELEDEEG